MSTSAPSTSSSSSSSSSQREPKRQKVCSQPPKRLRQTTQRNVTLETLFYSGSQLCNRMDTEAAAAALDAGAREGGRGASPSKTI